MEVPPEYLAAPNRIHILALWADSLPDEDCPWPGHISRLRRKIGRAPQWWVDSSPEHSWRGMSRHVSVYLTKRTVGMIDPDVFADPDYRVWIACPMDMYKRWPFSIACQFPKRATHRRPPFLNSIRWCPTILHMHAGLARRWFWGVHQKTWKGLPILTLAITSWPLMFWMFPTTSRKWKWATTKSVRRHCLKCVWNVTEIGTSVYLVLSRRPTWQIQSSEVSDANAQWEYALSMHIRIGNI